VIVTPVASAALPPHAVASIAATADAADAVRKLRLLVAVWPPQCAQPRSPVSMIALSLFIIVVEPINT
jgi:hypothetical protein